MTFVRVIAAQRCPPEADWIAVADVEFDGLLTIAGVVVAASVAGNRTALPPRRPWSGTPILAWSDRVAQRVADAILAVVSDGTVAFAGERTIDGVPERMIPSSELPADPADDGEDDLVDTDLFGTVAARPGVSVAELAGLLGLHRVTVSRQVRDEIAAGRLRVERDGARHRLFSAEAAA